MPVFVLVILCVWIAAAAFALLLCVAARRTDEDLAGTDLAPVIDISAALSSRRHVA
jgi:hypothetical protein